MHQSPKAKRTVSMRKKEEGNLDGAKGVCWALGWLSGAETD